MKKLCLVLVLLLASNTQTLADFSACRSAHVKPNFETKIRLYTICIKSPLSEAQRSKAYTYRGITYYNKSEYDLALSDFSKAIDYRPKWKISYLYRGYAHFSLKKYDLAEIDLNFAVESRSKKVRTRSYALRGSARSYMGRYPEAISDFDNALRLGKKYAEAYNSKAWFLATCPEKSFRNSPLAIELALKAVDRIDSYYTRGTLAAAYAEAGQFEHAIREQELSLQLLREAGGTSALADLESRLELYRQHLPFHETVVLF